MKSFVKSKHIRYLCIAISFGTLMALLIPAGNRAIVENQLLLLNPFAEDSSSYLPDIPVMVQTTSYAGQSTIKRLHEIAMKKPMDMGVQIGYLTIAAPHSLDELQTIVRRFPYQPSVYSAVLLCALSDQSNNPNITDFTIQLASQGERMDPDNAFFPFVLAYIRYLRHDDKAGWLAFTGIEKCKKWDSYVNDAVRDNARLARIGFGYQSALGGYFDADAISSRYLAFAVGLPALINGIHQHETKQALKTSQGGSDLAEIAIQSLQERQIWSHLLELMIKNPSSYVMDKWNIATIYIVDCVGIKYYVSWLEQAPKSLTNDQQLQWIFNKFATHMSNHPSDAGSWYSPEIVSVFLRQMEIEKARDDNLAYASTLVLWWAIGATSLALLLLIVVLSGLSYLFHPSGRFFTSKPGWASAGAIIIISGIVFDEIGGWMHFDMRYVIVLGFCAVIFAFIGMFTERWVWRGIWIGGLMSIKDSLSTPEIAISTPEIKISNLFMCWWVIIVVSSIIAITLHFIRRRKKENNSSSQKLSVIRFVFRLVLSMLRGVYVFLLSMLVSVLIFGFLYISCCIFTALIFSTIVNPHHLDVLYLWSGTFSQLYNIAQCYIMRSNYFHTSDSIHTPTLILFIIPLVVPILFVIGLLYGKVRNHITLSSSIVGGFRKYGWWCACLLLLVYGSLVLLTAWRERIVSDALLNQDTPILRIHNS